MQRDAADVASYLASLPDDQRASMQAVLDVVRKNLPKGYEEVFAWGMVTWQVPLAVYPDTYNKKPLMFAALAAQKGHFSLYLCNVYGSDPLRERFEEGFRKAGKKLDMGKSCVRFKTADALPLDVIGEAISATPMDAYVTSVKATHAATKTGAKKKAARG